jgi:hypothetical protein
MRLAAFPPSERLRPYVRSISVMETDRAEASAVLPQPGLMLGFRYAGSATLFENGEESGTRSGACRPPREAASW